MNIKLLLDKASEMIPLIKERNRLIDASSNKSIISTKSEFEKAIAEVKKQLASLIVSENTQWIGEEYVYMLEADMNTADATYEKSNKDISELSSKIEKIKEEIKQDASTNVPKKLKKEEIPAEKIYELVLVILITEFQEDVFFENKEDFFDLIKESKDESIMELYDFIVIDGTINKSNLFDSFISKIE